MSSSERKDPARQLTDEELDAILLDADAELLEFVRCTTSPTGLLTEIMASNEAGKKDLPRGGWPKPADISEPDHAITVIMTRDLAHDVARDIDLAREIATGLDHGREWDDGLDLAHILDLALDHARALTRALASKGPNAGDLWRAVGLAARLTAAIDRERDHARVFAHASGLAASLASIKVDSLIEHLNSIEVYVSDTDLSFLDLNDIDVLNGVVWTQFTIWPPSLIEEIRRRSHEIGPGLYQIGWRSEDPAPLTLV
ncbi:hypothetical protein [Microbispora sp. H10885]|uniref:hypothetical protein n=1 Tax=Microbispora sp. H10885 TaxID=2729110 RepID=UPI001600C1FB|nr:hypothetical protein [Microbispora sp. H10885]